MSKYRLSDAIGWVGEVSAPNGSAVKGYFLDRWVKEIQPHFDKWVEERLFRAWRDGYDAGIRDMDRLRNGKLRPSEITPNPHGGPDVGEGQS